MPAHHHPLIRRLAAEAIGSCIFLAAIIGSGIMGTNLSGGQVGLALLINAVASGTVLFIVITGLGRVSGAHFNPAVTLVAWLADRMHSWREAVGYVLAQCFGAVVGVWIAHAEFEQVIFQHSGTARPGMHLVFGEFVATFGLIFTIIAIQDSPNYGNSVPAAVGLYVMAAWLFTSSACFANPAVTLARAFSDTFTGIRPVDMPVYIAAQLVGAVAGWLVAAWVVGEPLKRGGEDGEQVEEEELPKVTGDDLPPRSTKLQRKSLVILTQQQQAPQPQPLQHVAIAGHAAVSSSV